MLPRHVLVEDLPGDGYKTWMSHPGAIVPIEHLSLQAGLCVRAGMSPERALLTVTQNAAKVLVTSCARL